MKDIIDISISVSPELAVWPGSSGIRVDRLSEKSNGDFATNSRITMDVHLGTHIDAPLHHIPKGKSTVELDLEKCNGICKVVDFCNYDIITRKDLEKKFNAFTEMYTRILLKTDNSSWLTHKSNQFNENFTAIDETAAKWLVEYGVSLIGIDYYSIQKYGTPPDVHEILLREEVIILESINLFSIEEGDYELICAPLKIEGLEGVPCRSFITQVDGSLY